MLLAYKQDCFHVYPWACQLPQSRIPIKMSDPYMIASWTCCVTAVVGFAIYSVIFTAFERRRAPAGKKQTTEDFVTARKTANLSQIAWSFYATSVGAWVIVTPANYAVFAGWIGMVMYAVAVGIPTIAIAFLGEEPPYPPTMCLCWEQLLLYSHPCVTLTDPWYMQASGFRSCFPTAPHWPTSAESASAGHRSSSS